MRLYGDCLWRFPAGEKKLFLTFDDGPTPGITDFVIDTLQEFNAKGTFFCLGKQAESHPQLYKKLLNSGNAVGNHTFSHYDGWRTANSKYYTDIDKAAQSIKSNIFRPPFGHILPWQVNTIKKRYGLKTVLWSVLSGDFDENTSGQTCLNNVVKNAESGSIIVFHDTDLAFKNLEYTLPKVLEHYGKKGYIFDAIR